MQLLHLFVIFHNFSNFANFHVFCNFSTESACPTRSHQLLFSRRGDPSFWQTVGGQSNLHQTWYGVQWFFMITTRHGFSLNSGFTKIWSPPDLPLSVLTPSDLSGSTLESHLCCCRSYRSFVPRDYSRQRTESQPSPGWAWARLASTVAEEEGRPGRRDKG